MIGTSRCPEKYPRPIGYRLAKLDITDPKSIKEFACYVKNIFGQVDILINNASRLYYGTIYDGNFETFLETVNSVVIGHVRVIREFLPLMRKSGYAKIGTTVSLTAYVRLPGYISPYAMGKVALAAAVDALIIETSKDERYRHIDFFTVNPSFVSTEIGMRAYI